VEKKWPEILAIVRHHSKNKRSASCSLPVVFSATKNVRFQQKSNGDFSITRKAAFAQIYEIKG
tara:strand:- start:4317 stop:4505 length:189 start_codon:yes stop_codon:yes gene_type:complete